MKLEISRYKVRENKEFSKNIYDSLLEFNELNICINKYLCFYYSYNKARN